MNEFKRKCKRCGHEWLKRQESEPVACPKCKSSLWDMDKKNKPGAGRPIKNERE